MNRALEAGHDQQERESHDLKDLPTPAAAAREQQGNGYSDDEQHDNARALLQRRGSRNAFRYGDRGYSIGRRWRRNNCARRGGVRQYACRDTDISNQKRHEQEHRPTTHRHRCYTRQRGSATLPVLRPRVLCTNTSPKPEPASWLRASAPNSFWTVSTVRC